MGYEVRRLAVVNATHKGERIAVNGESLGVDGVDGRQQYVVGFKPANPETGVPAYYTCGCPAWKFQGWRKHGLVRPQPCKHILAFLARLEGGKVENGATIRKDSAA